jgi:hypothetical protein
LQVVFCIGLGKCICQARISKFRSSNISIAYHFSTLNLNEVLNLKVETPSQIQHLNISNGLQISTQGSAKALSGIALSLHSLFTHSPTANTSRIPCEVTSITTEGMKFDQCANITKSPNIKDQYKKTQPFRTHKHFLQVVINEQTTCTTNIITSAICGRWEE